MRKTALACEKTFFYTFSCGKCMQVIEKVQKQVLSRICPGFNLKILTKDWNPVLCEDFGRDEATRTPDPYVPNVVRYQLRYIPIFRFFLTITSSGFARHRSFAGANSRLPRLPSSFSTKINFKKLFLPERNFGFIVVIGHLQEQTPVFLAHLPRSRQK